MTDSIWRLMWALPLVLFAGAAAILVLRRFVMPGQAGEPRQRIRLRESMRLSGQSCLYLIEVDGRSHLIVESTQQLQILSQQPAAKEPPAWSMKPVAPWLRHLRKADAR